MFAVACVVSRTATQDFVVIVVVVVVVVVVFVVYL